MSAFLEDCRKVAKKRIRDEAVNFRKVLKLAMKRENHQLKALDNRRKHRKMVKDRLYARTSVIP